MFPTIQFLTVPNPYPAYSIKFSTDVAEPKVKKILLPQNSSSFRMKQKRLLAKKKSRSSSKTKIQFELLKQHIENIKIERIKLSLENEELRLSLNKPSNYKSQTSHAEDLDLLQQMLGFSEVKSKDNRNHSALSKDSCSPKSEFKDKTSSDDDSGVSSESDIQSEVEDSWMEDFFSVLRPGYTRTVAQVSLEQAVFVSSPQLKDWALVYLLFILAAMAVFRRDFFRCQLQRAVTHQFLPPHIPPLQHLQNPIPTSKISSFSSSQRHKS